MESENQPVWKIALKSILLFILVVAAAWGLWLTWQAANSLVPALFIIALALFIGLLWAVVGRLLRRRRADKPPFWRSWLGASTIWSLVFLALLTIPFLFANFMITRRPLAMPRITLTDGQKEVIFQGMVHVGSEPYYQSVVFDMTRAADMGYDLFFEGVQPGSPENERALQELLGTGGQDLNQSYNQFANRCNLRFQNDYFAVFADDLRDRPDRFYMADVSVDEMMAEWQRLVAQNPEWVAEQTNDVTPEEEVDEQLTGVADTLTTLSPGQRNLAELGCKTMMTFMFSGSSLAEMPPFNENVILDYRNRYLVDKIIDHPNDKIYITYGNDHFAGMYDLLKEVNPSWEIVDVRWLEALNSSAEIERELRLE